MKLLRFSRRPLSAPAVPEALDDGQDATGGAGAASGSSQAGRADVQRILTDAVGSDRAARITIVPAELVGLHALSIPVKSQRQRRAALPYAVEDHIAAPLERTHTAYIRALPDERVLAASLSHDLMADLVARAPQSQIWPEQLVLPTPDTPHSWNALRMGDRVLLRADDGTGFAMRVGMVPAVWATAGRPTVLNRGAEPLPDTLVWTFADPVQPDAAELSVDLRQDRYRPRQNLGRPIAALVAGVALIGGLHLALAYGDLLALRGLAGEQRAATTALLAERVPQATIFDDPQVLYRRLTRADARAGGSGLLPNLEQASTALLAADVPLTIQRMVWSADPQSLTMQVEATGLDQLQVVEEALRLSGLSVEIGTATAGDGAARADLTIRPEGTR